MKLLPLFLTLCLFAPSRAGAQKINILYSNATFTGTAMYVAKDSGLCKQRGLDLELVMGAGSAPNGQRDYRRLCSVCPSLSLFAGQRRR